MMDEQTLQMGVTIRFPGSMMAVVSAERRKLFQPFIDIADQTVFGVVDVDPCGDVHRRDQDHAFLNATFVQSRLNFRRDVNIFPVCFRTKCQVFSVKLHHADDTAIDPVALPWVMRHEWLRSSVVGPVICAVFCFCISLSLSCAFGQQPAALPQPPQPGQSDPANPAPNNQIQNNQTPGNQTSPDQGKGKDAQVVEPRTLPAGRPPTAEELRQKQIDAFDPLAKDPAGAASTGGNTSARSPENNPTPAASAQRPLPGSVAESNLPAGRHSEGPQIDGDQSAVDQEYNGPAVLSRSYTLTRPMVPKQIRWSWTIGGGETYISGLVGSAPVAGAPLTSSTSFGTNAFLSFQGRHLWKHDQIGVVYNGSYNNYTAASSYSGTNQTVSIDYGHEFSRHLQLNIVETAAILTQSGTLSNPLSDPGVSPANISLAASPTVQLFDQTIRQSTTQISVTWQKTARLSFNYSAGLFGLQRTGAQLYGDSGYQAQTDINYRVTRKMTVGAYYSYLTYVFSHHLSDSHTQTAGLIYSYAIMKTMQLRTRAGVSHLVNSGLVTVPINPVIAALIGRSSDIVETYQHAYTSDISAELVKDFGERRTANISYAHGVSPGNGLILTSTQQVIGASYNMLLFRHYRASVSAGQTSLLSTLQSIGKYTSDYASLNISRSLAHNVSANIGFSYRTYSISGISSVQPQFLISSGVSWGPGEGKLW